MSAFAAIFQRSNVPVDPGALERALAQLKHRGPDGWDTHLSQSAALGHLHFWTTPEETGEKQPLQLAGLPLVILFDGRLDNRLELLSALQMDQQQAGLLSDAALVLHAYSRWGKHCFERFIGAFALVIWDEDRHELVCARDALGDRTLYYSLETGRLVIASEPRAVLAGCGFTPSLDETSLAFYYVVRTPDDGRTLFRNVREILPAQVMAVTPAGEYSWHYWRADPTVRTHYHSDGEYAEHFQSLLEESVRCRLRASTPVGVLMSGGLDSTSVASLAARMLAPTILTTISYVFNDFPDCDEREYIQAISSHYATRSLQIPCDDAWPLRDWPDWPVDPNLPEGNPYRLLKERAYHTANQAGLRVLLTGGFGDGLYSGDVDWLSDLVTEGRLLEAGRELGRHIGASGIRQTVTAGFFRRMGRRVLNHLPGGRRLQRRRMPSSSPWLTPFAANCLAEAEPDFNPSANLPYLNRQAGLVGTAPALNSSAEIYHASRHTLELRHPYRDRRLVEFMLSIPAHQFYNHNLYKHILRNAMQGILPEIIRCRPYQTSLISLYLSGFRKEKALFSSFLQNPAAGWRKYVRADWLSNQSSALFQNPQDGVEILMPWLCVSTESWFNSLEVA
jgi:asparagine synthase (glutamine-hydrolysing)